MASIESDPRRRLVWPFFVMAALAVGVAVALLTVRGITSPENVHIALLAAALAAAVACAGCLKVTCAVRTTSSTTVRLARWTLARLLYFMQVAALALALWCMYLLFCKGWLVHPH